MKTREARENALLNLSRHGNLRVNDLMSAITYVSSNSSLKGLCDVLNVEHEVERLKKAINNAK